MREYREVRFRSNNPEAASEYLGFARTLLGQLKNEMRFANLMQGVRRKLLQHPCGLVEVTVMSIFGQDQISISLPSCQQPTGKRERRDEFEPTPYLWVGVRIRWDLMEPTEYWDSSIAVYLSEPHDDNTPATEHRGIIYNEESSTVAYGPNLYATVYVDDEEPSWDGQDTNWADDTGTPENRRFYGISDHFGNSQHTTKNGLRVWDSWDFSAATWATRVNPQDEPIENLSDATILPPHDPLADSDVDLNRVMPDWHYLKDTPPRWDVVFCLDPSQGEGKPTNKLPGDREIAEAIARTSGLTGTGTVVPGEYALKIVRNGPDCYEQASGTTGWREDYTVYPVPVVVEIEVRAGKNNTNTQTFIVSIEQSTYFYRNLWPFGDPYQSDTLTCPQLYGGPNKHHDCWWQDCILVDVENSEINLASQYAPDYFGENVGTRDPYSCYQYAGASIYIGWYPPYAFVCPLSYLIDATYDLLTYGCQNYSYALPETTHAEVEAALTGVVDVAAGLYRYNVFTKSCEAVTDAVSDPNPSHSTTYAWEDYYRIYERDRGFLFARIVYGVGVSQWDNFPYTGDPEATYNTCLDYYPR